VSFSQILSPVFFFVVVVNLKVRVLRDASLHLGLLPGTHFHVFSLSKPRPWCVWIPLNACQFNSRLPQLNGFGLDHKWTCAPLLFSNDRLVYISNPLISLLLLFICLKCGSLLYVLAYMVPLYVTLFDWAMILVRRLYIDWLTGTDVMTYIPLMCSPPPLSLSLKNCGGLLIQFYANT
jgi:hypothetical protein